MSNQTVNVMYVRLTKNEELVANGVNILLFTNQSYVFVGCRQHTDDLYFWWTASQLWHNRRGEINLTFYTSLIQRKLRCWNITECDNLLIPFDIYSIEIEQYKDWLWCQQCISNWFGQGQEKTGNFVANKFIGNRRWSHDWVRKSILERLSVSQAGMGRGSPLCETHDCIKGITTPTFVGERGFLCIHSVTSCFAGIGVVPQVIFQKSNVFQQFTFHVICII